MCHRNVFFFFATLCSLRPNQQQQTSVLSPNSPQPCCVSSMTIVFPFGGVAFSRGWLWVSHSFLPRRMCEHRLHSWYRLLIHPLRLNVCCNNAVIGVGAKLNLFAKFSAKFGRAVTASNQFFGRCFSCKSIGLALHYVSVSSLHFVAKTFAARARVRVWYCWQRICIRRERTSWTYLVSFLHFCGCVAQAVILASRNDLVLIFFAWVFSTYVQQPLRCLRT